MPRYTLRERKLGRNPVVEILCDGDPWGLSHPGQEHFSFGLRKAFMILSAVELVAEFHQSQGEKPAVGVPIGVSDEYSQTSFKKYLN